MRKKNHFKLQMVAKLKFTWSLDIDTKDGYVCMLLSHQITPHHTSCIHEPKVAKRKYLEPVFSFELDPILGKEVDSVGEVEQKVGGHNGKHCL